MTAALRPHPLQRDECVPPSTPSTQAPSRWVTCRDGAYVHIPRSMSTAGAWGGVVRYWCGGSSFVHSARWLDAPTDRPVCGTCIGRDLGVNVPDNAIAFAPRKAVDSIATYRWCPGPRLGLHAPTGRPMGLYGEHQCLLCGHTGRVRAGGSPYRPSMAFERHAPAQPTALIYCPTCGWRHLRIVAYNGRKVECTRWSCDWRGYGPPPPRI